MCAPRVTRHTSIRYSSSCHTRFTMVMRVCQELEYRSLGFISFEEVNKADRKAGVKEREIPESMNIVSDTRWLAFHGLRVFTRSVSCISVIRVASQLLSSYRHLHSTAQFKGGVILATKRRVSVNPDCNLLPRKSLVMPYQKEMLIHFWNDLVLSKADT